MVVCDSDFHFLLITDTYSYFFYTVYFSATKHLTD